MGLFRRRAQLSLNRRQIGELVEELSGLLTGATLRDVEARPPRDAVLAFLPGSQGPDAPILRIYLSCQGETGRLHLQHGRLARHTGPEGPFYQRLMEDLSGAELRKIQQVRGDRLVLFEFSTEKGRRALVLELTGRHSNLLLLGKGDEVLELLVPPPKKQAKPRLVRGLPWTPPPGRAEEIELQGITEAFPAPKEEPDSVKRGHPHRAPLSYWVECALAPQADEEQADTLRRDLTRRLERRRSRTEKALRGLEHRTQAADGAERIMQDGELLKAAQAQIKRGAESIKLTDYFSAEPIEREIKLDPKLSPGENAAKYFNRYKKLIRSVDGIEEERSRQGEKLAQIRALLARLEEKTEAPESIEAEALKAGLLEQRQESDTRKRKSPAPRLPYKSFTSCRGSEIRVGRTAKDNDQLTFRHANGKDLWLHTADAPGSHVVLRRQGNKEPDDEEVIDAATLAVHFSPLKAVSRADVHTAHVKEIKKPRGAKAGLVTLSGGKTLHIRMQPERLKRLLDREARPHKQ